MVTKNTFYLLGLLFLGCLAIVAVAVHLIGGGDATLQKVISAASTNEEIISRIGAPIRLLKNPGGPSEIEIADNGRRNGFYSITAEGSKTKETLKVYWRELPDGDVEITALFRTESFRDDQLIWESNKR